LQPFQDFFRGLFQHHEGEFGPYSFAFQLGEEIHFYCISDQAKGVLANLKAKPVLKSDCPENPGGILNKAQAMKYSDGLFLDVPLGTKKINKKAEGVFVQRYGECIDRKIAPVKIELKGAMLDNRKCGRRPVIFESGRSNVYFEAIRVSDFCC